MAEYVVVSTAVIDDIWSCDHRHAGCYLGGAGIYALSGLGVWTDSAVLVTGVGGDFLENHGEWFARNRLSTQGLLPRCGPTPVTTVRYQTDESRMETPRFGWEHYEKMEATPEEILSFVYRETKGVYVFQKIPDGYWEPLLAAKKKLGFALEWEINGDVATPAWGSRVRQIAEQCDVFSLNLKEAGCLLGLTELSSILAELTWWRVPLIYLRLGSHGAALIRDGTYIRVPSVPGVKVVDPTGAGNASSAAVLYGYCNQESDLACGRMAAFSAARCISQYGPPENLRDGEWGRIL